MKKIFLLLFLLTPGFARSEEPPILLEDTWANWEKRFDRAYEGINPHKMPGRAMGILVPNETRTDLLAMSAFGYETLSSDKFSTVIILLPAPNDIKKTGLIIPDLEKIETPVGDFTVDLGLALKLENESVGIRVDNSLFMPNTPKLLEIQLAGLKYVLKTSKSSRVKVLPIYVNFADANAQSKDVAPLIADRIKDLEMEGDIVIVMSGNLSRTKSKSQLIHADSQWLSAIRNLDADEALAIEANLSSGTISIDTPDSGVISLGLLMLRWLGADHGEILAYAHSGQLILTKDKSAHESYVTAAFASGPLIETKLNYFNREKMVDTFGELLRTDILSVTRQTCASALDPTAAKPPSLIDKQASRKWPVYVSLYDAKGDPAGQAGTHVAVGPLEESLRRFAVEATRRAQPSLSKSNFSTYVVDVSIPYGFMKVSRPEELVPLLNGLIVHRNNKASAMHPDGWRKYPDPHQLLGEICFGLGMKPWAYATAEARVESFRTLSFNEKEPFQDLGAANRKKKKKTDNEEASEDAGGGGGELPF